MTSKKLLPVTSRLPSTSLCLFASLCVVALALSACDDKAQDDGAADVANLADSANTRSQGQQKTDDEGEEDKPAKRTSASSPGEATVTQKAPLDASLYLIKNDVAGLERYPQVRTSELAGKESSPTYGTVRLSPQNNDNYGAALQLWKFDNEKAAEEMVVKMREQYLGVADAPKNAPIRRKNAFLSTRAGITTYVFEAAGDSGTYVAALSCGDMTCPKGWTNVRPTAESILERLENPSKLKQVRERRKEMAEKGTTRDREKLRELERQKEKEAKERREEERKRRE
jgi:hypothetical protein